MIFDPKRAIHRALFYSILSIFTLVTCLYLGALLFKKDTPSYCAHVDFCMRYNSARDFLSGTTPYAQQRKQLNLKQKSGQLPYNDPSVQSDWHSPSTLRALSLPMQVFFFFPFLPYYTAKSIHLFTSVILLFLLPILLARRYGFLKTMHWHSPRLQDMIAASLFFLYLNAAPVAFALSYGQPTIIVACCLLAAFFLTKKTWCQSLLLLIATIAKYNLMPLFLICLLFKKQFRILIYVGIGLLLSNLIPLLAHGISPIQAASEYLALIRDSLFTSQSVEKSMGLFSLLNVDYLFQSTHLAWLIKAVLLTSLLLVYRHEWRMKRASISVTTFCLLSLITMLIVYQRLFNAIMLLPLFSVFTYQFFLKKKTLPFLFSFLGLTLLALPLNVMFVWSSFLSSAIFSVVDLGAVFSYGVYTPETLVLYSRLRDLAYQIMLTIMSPFSQFYSIPIYGVLCLIIFFIVLVQFLKQEFLSWKQ